MIAKKCWPQFVAITAISVFFIHCAPACRADNTYHFLKEIPVGGEGGWDTLSIDEAAHRLYVSHATKVMVIDLDKEEVVGEITDTPGVHGFAPVPEFQRGFSSNGQESKASIVDLKTLKTLSKVDTGENPDVILYDPGQQEVYAFNGRGQSATVIEAKTGKVVATIGLPGKPEFAAADSKSGRVYCNIEDKNSVVAIDTKTHQIVNTWPIAPGEEASGMAIDLVHHRLFLGCGNKLMVMMDSTNGKVVGTVPSGDRIDGTAFDPGPQLAFTSNGDGTVTIAHEDSPDKLTAVQILTTERGARTMALDPKTHRIYLPSAKYEPQSTPAPGATRQRPKIVPGSFKVLVYGMDKTADH
ncbi:MAG TPA: YncE family protein [Verrucomicrobiae bacterium]|nr:YncE family protein [Verrucomicrobiae bacterium]